MPTAILNNAVWRMQATQGPTSAAANLLDVLSLTLDSCHLDVLQSPDLNCINSHRWRHNDQMHTNENDSSVTGRYYRLNSRKTNRS